MKNFKISSAINNVQDILIKDDQKMQPRQRLECPRLSRSDRNTISDLIRSNAKYSNGCYKLWVSDLSFDDQKLLLSCIKDPSDYEWACEDAHRLQTVIAESKPSMQLAINELIDDVWHEDMQEMGRTLCHCNQTGEPYYR